MPYTQQGRTLKVDTVLGPDVLLLTGLAGEEGVSRPFRFALELASEDPALDAAAILGTPARVTIALPAGGERTIHGLVSRFRQVDARAARIAYEAELVAWPWMLSLSTDCRIFQHRSVVDIVTQVFDELGYRDYAVRLIQSYAPREYCVQYRETHLDFVSRLLEDEGIFYYFQHEAERHVLVLADSPAAVRPCADLSALRRAPKVGSTWREDVYTSVTVEHAVQTRAVGLADYNYLTPSAQLRVACGAAPGGGRTTAPFEAFDYPGGFADARDGDRYARLRLESAEAQRETATGTSTAPALTPGCKVDFEDAAPAVDGRSWLVLEVRHTAQQANYKAGEDAAFTYENGFTLVPADVPWHPPRSTPRPRVHGTQSALVVGVAGEEISTDAQGRVKLHFYWDRYSARNLNSSCWVRCSAAIAGNGWGHLAVPRIGQEVLVDFLEGDPDRPVVVGRVYNGERPPPCDPGRNGGVVSGMRSKTHKGSGYNALTMDDTTGKELISIHAQYDMDTVVEHDERVRIGHDRTETVGHDETITIGANRTERVGASETGSVGTTRTWQVGTNDSLTVGGARTETVAQMSTETVGAVKALTIGAAYQISVGGVLNATVGGAMIEEIGAFRTILVAKKFSLEAGDEIVLKTGSASITLKKNGDIIVKGNKISITGSGDVVVKGSKIGAN